MPRRYIRIIEHSHKRKGDLHIFRVGIEISPKGKPERHTFEVPCPNHELNALSIERINDQLANSVRYCKHAGGYFDKNVNDKDAATMLDKLSSTNTGLGVRVKEDPLPEFIRFAL